MSVERAREKIRRFHEKEDHRYDAAGIAADDARRMRRWGALAGENRRMRTFGWGALAGELVDENCRSVD